MLASCPLSQWYCAWVTGDTQRVLRLGYRAWFTEDTQGTHSGYCAWVTGDTQSTASLEISNLAWKARLFCSCVPNSWKHREVTLIDWLSMHGLGKALIQNTA